MKSGLDKEQKQVTKGVISGKMNKKDLKKWDGLYNKFNKAEKCVEEYLDDYLRLEEDEQGFKNSKDFSKFIYNKSDKHIDKNDKITKDIIGLIYEDRMGAKLIYDKNNTKIKKTTYEFKKLVKKLKLDKKKNNIISLNKSNAKIIRNKMSRDASYIPFSKILYDYYTNSNSKKGIIIHNGRNKKNFVEDPLFIIMREIDRDNNTNVWRYKSKRESFIKIYKFIRNKRNKFFEKLENGDSEHDLPDVLTKASGANIKSFASKICKYLSEYIYGKDNYFINDNIIRHALPFYLISYKLPFEGIESSKDCEKLKYVELYNLLEKLQNKANEGVKKAGKITKDELDRIIWYSYKSFITV